MDIKCNAQHLENTHNEIIYKNPLLINDQKETFNFPDIRNKNKYFPTKIKELPVNTFKTRMPNNHRKYLSKINKSYWNLRREIDNANPRYALINGCTSIDIEKGSFNEIYGAILQTREFPQIWKQKWNEIVNKEDIVSDNEWKDIWLSVHDNIRSYQIQSSIWESIYLHFYCAYKERKMNYGNGICRLCHKTEESVQHIVIDCNVLQRLLHEFGNFFKRNEDPPLQDKEKVFGHIGKVSKITKLKSYILYNVRHSVFRNRHINFKNETNAVLSLSRTIKSSIRNNLINAYYQSVTERTVPNYIDTYLTNNTLGTVRDNTFILNI